jgi:hypothetical protein
MPTAPKPLMTWSASVPAFAWMSYFRPGAVNAPKVEPRLENASA